MSFDFRPKNKLAGDYCLTVIEWPTMLEDGLGLVLGTGEGFKDGYFFYIERPDKKCVQCNDGAFVTAKEAIELAKVARWIVRIQEARIQHWESLTAEERQKIETQKTFIPPWDPGRVRLFRDFANWAEKSEGFNVH